jgi:prephenate dehydrogenase
MASGQTMFTQLGVIGCGLMGGSFALALKRAGLVKRVVGYSKSPSTTERAKRMGVIDVAAESALLAVSGSDIVLIAVPVSASEVTFKAIRHLVEPGVLFMDVGSTKRDVVDAARRVLKERVPSFVPAHPITGKEVAGVHNSDAALYAGRQVILTPLPQTLPELVQKATDVWAAIGAQVLRMSLAGPGFRDFPRIAASDPTIWRDILMANREEILKQSARFRSTLDAMEHVIKSGNTDALEDLIRSAAEARAGWQLGGPRGGNKT